MTLNAASTPSTFSPFVIFVIFFGVLGIGGFIAHMILRGKHDKVLLCIAAASALGMIIFLPLWAKQVFGDINLGLVISTFILGALAFSCLLLYPYFSKTRIVSRCLLVGFLLTAIAFIVCAIFLSKHVFQPAAMNDSASSALISLLI